MNWQINKEWSDHFIRQLKQIAGLYTIGVGNQIQDQEEGTDLIVLESNPHRIACRVRRPEYYPKYRFDITIRSRVPSGTRTEYPKLMSEDETWNHIYIYAFSEKEYRIKGYHVIDIPIFREWVFGLIEMNNGQLPIDEMDNHDGTFFYPFSILKMPVKAIIHSTEKR